MAKIFSTVEAIEDIMERVRTMPKEDLEVEIFKVGRAAVDMKKSKDREIAKLIAGFKAQDKLLCCYRVGGDPSQKVFDDIAAARAAIAQQEHADE